jgi:hypothetical protein
MDAYISIGNNTMSFMEGTISVWIKWDGGSAAYEIVSFFTDKDNYFTIDIQNDGKLYHFLKTDGVVRWKYESNDKLTPGSWYNLILMQDGLKPKTYINGVEINQSLVEGSTSYDSYYLDDLLVGSAFAIGAREQTSVVGYFNGIIDDIRIYNRAISATEIQRLYWGGGNTTSGSTACPPTTTGCSQSDLDTQYQAGKDYCKSNPSACGITSTGSNNSITINSDLSFIIPNATYNPAIGNPMDLELNFKYKGSELLWELDSYSVK